MNIRARAEAARNVAGVTCPASRHVQEIAEAFLLRPDLREAVLTEREHCAESMLAVVAALWEARAELAKMKEPT